jgi:hypothetical protein
MVLARIHMEFSAEEIRPSPMRICTQGKGKRHVEYNFEGSARAREIIQLLVRTILIPGGRASPWEWWGFESIGIRARKISYVRKKKLESCRQEDSKRGL